MSEAIKEKRRSAAYPGVSLEDALTATKQLRDNLGAGPYSRESAAQAMGYNGVSGASSTKVAACVHFGLLDRENNVYRQSDLSKQIFVFTSEDERRAALRVAIQKPTLYAKLFEAFDGSALPAMLSNVLVRNYQITERVAKEAASNFIHSAEYAGVLANGVLNLDNNLSHEDSSHDAKASNINAHVADTKIENPPKIELTEEVIGYLPVTIPGTKVRILFPAEYAYELSIGSFKTGIEALASSIKRIGQVDERDNTSEV